MCILLFQPKLFKTRETDNSILVNSAIRDEIATIDICFFLCKRTNKYIIRNVRMIIIGRQSDVC